ncbi:hypothetical protein LX32DRAFT_341526 [Colletotrichum zoysiae]|uniref:Uncharacterized protein n=1 Tax=Colletotrichum zoysiae TaxID=1216348 RepID=A0AAD9M0X4_9PEZI|nr:hypothetical protein LX32DRAFT_341526 [Colletotrichum zoysiae]
MGLRAPRYMQSRQRVGGMPCTSLFFSLSSLPMQTRQEASRPTSFLPGQLPTPPPGSSAVPCRPCRHIGRAEINNQRQGHGTCAWRSIPFGSHVVPCSVASRVRLFPPGTRPEASGLNGIK